ncbi:MAG: PRC-barrel domain-containing protein [Candidatus Omnitrophica bacterium]|nr:PRC-barrel domain-containing protein [Candidatus Omnitrophota bacterium]MCM8826410.1 PRC-barrel domain-containing protein [Candidatus Omnitrophota bacterium]
MRSKEIIGKEVVSVKEGKKLGRLRSAVIDGVNQRVVGFIVDDEEWFLETKIILFYSIRGMEDELVTIDDSSSVICVKHMDKIQPYLRENIQLINMRIISATGKFIGKIEDFIFNNQTGKIETYIVEGKDIVIDWKDVVSLSREMLIVKGELLNGDIRSNIAELNEVTLNSLFEKRQEKFLLGKYLIRDIRDEEGNLIVSTGELVDETLIKKIRSLGKFTELLMSVEEEEG